MANYTQIFKLLTPDNISKNYPVEISAGVLLREEESKKILVQLKLKNVSTKSIKNVTVSISAYDSEGRSIKNNTVFTYQNVAASVDAYFGDRIPIIMDDRNTSAFDVDIISVNYSDGTSWSKLNTQIKENAKELKESAKEAVTESVKTAETVGKGSWNILKKVYSPIAFVINTILDVFLIVMAVTYFYIWKTEGISADFFMMIVLLLMAIVAFPVIGTKLKSKKNGLVYNVIRWLIVCLIFFIGGTLIVLFNGMYW